VHHATRVPDRMCADESDVARTTHDLAPARLVVASLLLLLAPTKPEALRKQMHSTNLNRIRSSDLTRWLKITASFQISRSAGTFYLFLGYECQGHACALDELARIV